jgi:negative regulator of flagellin synthesis FlgM
MEVHGPSSVGVSLPISHNRPAASIQENTAVSPMSPRDEVDISAVGKMLDDVSRTPGIREQRLAQIKAAIDAGTYDTPEKLEIALSRLFDQLGHDDTK